MRAATASVSPTPLTGGRRRRGRGRGLVRGVSSLLIVCGVLLLADAGLTLVWQEPVTAAIGLLERAHVDRRFLSYRTAPLSRPDERLLQALRGVAQRIAFLARREQRQLSDGDAVGQLLIPRIGASFTVVQGTGAGSLARGPGHYPSTALPGLGQTVAIAGHRTTYLAPFRDLGELTPGDRIVLRMPYGRFVYSVQYQRIVTPNAWWITRNHGYDRLVLSACNPLYSAAQRIAVFARLDYVQPLAAARKRS
jgi:sortase A